MAKALKDRSRCLFFSSSRLPLLKNLHRSFETLAFEELRVDPERPTKSTALVLHGLLGSGRNWRSFSRRLVSSIPGSEGSPDLKAKGSKKSKQRAASKGNHASEALEQLTRQTREAVRELKEPTATRDAQEWRMVLVDLRNHGRSAGLKGLEPPHNMESAAKDLADLVKSHGWAWPDVVIGHSMGGKVALAYADSCKQLWVLDSVPGDAVSDSDGEVENVLKTLQSLPTTLPSRKWLVDQMLNHSFSKSLSDWIGSNLKKAGDGMTWAFDLQAAIDMFHSYREKSYLSLLENPPKGLEIALVRAENSDRWTQPVLRRLESLSSRPEEPDRGKVSLHVLPRSGHWVHVDNPKGLLEIMAPNFFFGS
ncbi:hypothetical protein QJS10_CPA02g01006 [Acorus calamus]|uniref:AB hydrolase-1 domain-containing protein n=1 Tax=Acorus calamus TaxID=4465 RepID=A0AAV9FEL9_ACOCL|nr:hypothetical protein QJS10_CPA02g01006 [Acorus calamus]